MIASIDRETKRDLKTLARFISIYCRGRHIGRPKNDVSLKTHDVTEIAGEPVRLCPSCARLLTHAFAKRSHCPMHPKPACKDCPSHCYHPAYRRKIQEVMRYSGIRLLLTGRLDYLLHLVF